MSSVFSLYIHNQLYMLYKKVDETSASKLNPLIYLYAATCLLVLVTEVTIIINDKANTRRE